MPTRASPVYQTTESAQLPAAHRYDDWLVPLLSDFQAASADARQRRDFRGRVTSLVTATGELHDMQADDFQGCVSTRQIRRDWSDKLALLYVAGGRILGQYQDEPDSVTAPGQFLWFDARRPSRLSFRQARFIQLNLPRAGLQDVLAGHHAMGALSQAVSGSGLAGLLRAQLHAFGDLVPRLTPQEQTAFLQCTQDLATTVIGTACLDLGRSVAQPLNGVLVAAQRFIDANLDACVLDAASIATALGCSRATLYRAFAQQESTVADYVRERRLHQLARLLQRASGQHTIAQLAQRCGLHDAPNLSRMFRRRFGVTPRQYRANHAAGVVAPGG